MPDITPQHPEAPQALPKRTIRTLEPMFRDIDDSAKVAVRQRRGQDPGPEGGEAVSLVERIEIAWGDMRERQISAHPERFTWVGGIPFTRFEMWFWRFTGLSPEGGWRTLAYNLRHREPRRSVIRLAAKQIGRRPCQACREVSE